MQVNLLRIVQKQKIYFILKKYEKILKSNILIR